MFDFNSDSTVEGRLTDWPDDIVKNEPMLFGCDLATAMEKAGRITNDFLMQLSNEAFEAPDLIIDSRVHMLMPGWWPCIPGWHHDDVPRTRADGQPNYRAPDYKAKHALAFVGTADCPTEFALGECSMPEVPLGETIYERWDAEVERLVAAGSLKLSRAQPRLLHYFDWQTFHRGSVTLADGWRWFGRASWSTGRKPTNELRRQTQVYLPFPQAGW